MADELNRQHEEDVVEVGRMTDELAHLIPKCAKVEQRRAVKVAVVEDQRLFILEKNEILLGCRQQLENFMNFFEYR